MIHHFFRNEEGSSSILVIVLMVVLLVFGLAVLTTSLSNLRLSEKKRDWLDDYYQVEAKAFSQIAEIDTALIEASAEAKTIIASGDYADMYMLDEATNDASLNGAYAYVYQDILQTSLRTLIENNPSATLMISYDNMIPVGGGYEIPTTTLNFDVTSTKSAYPKHIEVTLRVLAPSEDNLLGPLSMIRRYDITGFVEWQTPFDYEDSLDFGDPFDDEGLTEENPFEDTPSEGNPFENLD